MTAETFFANFGHLADAPNGVQKLRELILQLAVQGKLVPQDPNDEPASVLLERIKAEKERLVEEGKIKKQKPLPEIGESEEPFVLPNGWQFVRLGNIANRIGSGSTPRGGKNAYVQSGIYFLRSQNIWNHGLELQGVAYIAPETHQKMSNTVVMPNDILLNITGASLGRCSVYPDELGEANVSQHVTIIRPTDERTKCYLHLCILSPYTQELVWGRQVGMAREGLSKKVLELFEIPLPPLEEQKRIVAKVEQLMALCDELETRQQKQQQGRVRLNKATLDALLTDCEPDKFANHWQRISTNFDLLYDHPETIAKLRAAILQLAVQGKLAPQDPNDEPASVLLERIKAEKDRLIKEGKTKRPKFLSDSKLTFQNLPEAWKETKLGDLMIFGPQNGYSPRSVDYETKTKSLTLSATTKGSFDSSCFKYIDETIKEDSPLWLESGDILIQRGNSLEYVGIGAVYQGQRKKFIYPDLIMKIRVSQSINVGFAHLVINCQSSREFFQENSSGTSGSMPKVNQAVVNSLPFPLPPTPEQKRIVAKVDQLMALCDELVAKLNQTQQHSEKLMEATVRQLLENSAQQKPC